MVSNSVGDMRWRCRSSRWSSIAGPCQARGWCCGVYGSWANERAVRWTIAAGGCPISKSRTQASAFRSTSTG
eukprot:9479471-Pyramimonas_sp.AAC.1